MAWSTRMALSSAACPAMSRKRTPSRHSSTTRRPLARASSSLSGATAGRVAQPGRERPIASTRQHMVLAVPMKAQAPGPPQALHSSS